MFLPGVKNIFASRTQIVHPKHMFPILATPGNITRNIVSATMFPSLARPLAMTTATARETSLKINTSPIVTIFDCPILFAFYIVGKIRYKWIGMRDVKLNAGNERFVVLCSTCQQNCKWGNFALLFCRGWHALVHKCVLHVQHAYFHSLDQSNS